MFQTEMTYEISDIVVDVSNIKYCVGPCNSKKEEPEPITINNKKNYVFKPNDGGRYKEYIYQIDNDRNIILKNARMCYNCNNRYLEFIEENHIDGIIKDGNIIKQKLKI